MSKKRKWSICSRCQGEGTSSAYLGAFTSEEFADAFDAEEREHYINGGYDRPCEQCNGTGKVTKQDTDAYAARRAEKYQEWLESGRPEGSFDKWCGL